MQTIWVELPAIDLERAIALYASISGHAPADIIDQGVRRITILPGTPCVSMNQTAGFTPTTEGLLPYLHVDEPFSTVLERVTRGGGRVIEPTERRGENGFFALIADSEGNGVTIHSAQA